jgi:hypothetical protein
MGVESINPNTFSTVCLVSETGGMRGIGFGPYETGSSSYDISGI